MELTNFLLYQAEILYFEKPLPIFDVFFCIDFDETESSWIHVKMSFIRHIGRRRNLYIQNFALAREKSELSYGFLVKGRVVGTFEPGMAPAGGGLG